MSKYIQLLLLFIIFLTGAANAQIPVTFNAKTDFTTGTGPRSVSIGDLNGDGLPDLAVTNESSQSVSVFLNTTIHGATTPTFTTKTDFLTGSYPRSVFIGDLNGDGKPDLAVANQGSNNVSVLLNTTTPGATTPSFSSKTDFITGNAPRSVSTSDFNGDGLPDFAVVNYNSYSVSVFLNTTIPGASTPSFSAKTDFSTGYNPSSVSIGDLNGDGKPDLAVTNSLANNVSVFLNTTTPGASTPSFSVKTDFAAGGAPFYVSIGDLNGDGKSDLVWINGGVGVNSVSVSLNTTTPGATTPTFTTKTDFTTGTNPKSVSIRDLNGDGKPDLAVANWTSASVSVFLNTTTPGASTPTFSSKTDFTTGAGSNSVSIEDLNGDSKPDLAVANVSSNNVSVLLNTTNIGTPAVSFTTNTDFTTGANPLSISIGNLNGDGMPDFAVTNQLDNTVSVFLNLTTPGASIPSFTAKTDFTTGSQPISVSIKDLNGDGKPDMAVANAMDSTVSVFLNITTPGNAIPTFTSKTDFTVGISPLFVSIRDLNGDGKPDLAVVNRLSENVSVLLNTTTPGASTPSFSSKTDFTTGSSPRTVSIEDMNGDFKPDLAVANESSNSVSVLLNTTIPGASTPTFNARVDFTTGTSPRSVFIGDLYGNGKRDLAVTNLTSASVSVLLNTTTPGAVTPTFTPKVDFTTGIFPFSVSIGDLNGDFKSDLAVANSTSSTVSVLLNTTGFFIPTFTKTDFSSTGINPLSISIGDLNGDFKPDLAVTNLISNTVSVLLNTTIVTGLDEVKNFIPSDYTLKQNYPNPFNPSTNISFSIPNEAFVTLIIYDVLGREVIQLVNQQLKTGNYNYSFDAANLTSGVYFYRLSAISGANNFVETKKMILLK